MSIRPVDMQAVMPRVMESSRAAANESARPAAEHQQFAQQLQRNVVHERQSVVSANKSEGQGVDKDGKGNSGGYSGRRQRKERSGEVEGLTSEGQNTQKDKKSLLDISL